MSDVSVKFKDGTTREFKEVGRSGGSYCLSVRYEGAFVVIIDEWGNRTAFPAADVLEVKERSRSW